MISIEKCRELIPNSKSLSDEEVVNQRDRLYKLAHYLIDKFEELTNFVKRKKTIEARARIVK